MAEIETLTQEERYEIFEKATAEELKLLRIHDAQAARIAELEAKLADRNLWEPGYRELEEHCKELKANWDACHQQHRAALDELAPARRRMAELEALLSESRSWLQTHDERGVLRELDELCERVDGMLSP